MKKKSIYFKLFTVLLCVAFLLSCTNGVESQINTDSQSVAAEQSSLNKISVNDINNTLSEMISFENNDFYSDWENQNPVYIELKGTTADIKGSGADFKENKITITAAGVYVLSGKMDNGQIVVDVQDKGTVKLVMNGVEINCVDNAPIYGKNAGEIIISLQDGTENIISDGVNYVYSDSTDEANAAIFSKDDLTINGTGKLTVYGNYNNGIASKDDLKITGGNIYIYSADDGLMGRDIVAVKEGSITIEAGGDGIKATNDTDTSKGFVVLEGGEYDIKAEADGIQAKNSILITNGIFEITTGGGSANGSVKVNDNGRNPWGNKEGNAGTTASTADTEALSAKGIKASVNIIIGGGTFNIDSADDALHSNNSITIADGDISIASGDDGIHADSAIAINGGKINISKSYEGIESAVITISNGEIHVVSSDDGINVAGGNDQSSVNGRPGQNNFSSSGNNKLIINGGYVTVDAAGDGLDANGSIYMSDGTVIVSGPTANNNGALDYDGVFEMSGGFLAAVGSSGMVQGPSDNSTQNSIIMNFSQLQQAGSVIHLKDSKGNTLVTFEPSKNYQSVVISMPEIEKNASYTVYSGEAKVVEFAISNSVTWLSESGVTAGRSSGPGAPSNPGFGDGQNRPEKRRPSGN